MDPSNAADTGSRSNWWGRWGSLILTLATGVAYVVGYCSVFVLSDELGIQSRDLDLDVRDYLLLTSLTFATWALAALLQLLSFSTQDRFFGSPILEFKKAFRALRRRGERRGGLVALLKLGVGFLLGNLVQIAFLFAVFVVSSFTGIDILAAVALVGVLGVAASLSRHSARFGVITIVLFAAISSYIMLNTAKSWASDVRAYAAVGTKPPTRMPFELILNPQIGFAAFDDLRACVLRVGGSVFLGRDSTLVIAVDSFSPAPCEVEANPFGLNDP